MAVGLVVSVWLFADQAIYVGYVPYNYPQFGDITFIVGFVISGGLYYVLNMNLRRQTASSRAAMGTRA